MMGRSISANAVVLVSAEGPGLRCESHKTYSQQCVSAFVHCGGRSEIARRCAPKKIDPCDRWRRTVFCPWRSGW
jgi:hypothetical protein